MKRVCFIISIFLLCENIFAQNTSLNGKIINSPTNAKIYLYEYFGSNIFLIDSTIIKNNQFKFSNIKSLPKGFYQLGQSQQNSSIFILANEQPSIFADWKDIKKTFQVNNSVENKYFFQLLDFNTKIGAIENQVKSIEEMKEKNPDAYTQKVAEIQKYYDSLNLANTNMKAEVMKITTTLFFAKVLKMFMINEKTEKLDFFTTQEYSDEEYTRGDMMVNKVAYYLQKYGAQDEKRWIDEAKELAQKAPINSKNRELFYIATIQVMVQSGMQLPSEIVSSLKSEYGKSPHTKALIAMLPKSEPIEGDDAPEIILPNANNQNVALSSLRGKIVLLDFWASWCGPCRMENPNVVAVYNYYKDKGFTIFSVSLDNSKENWQAAIKKDGLNWPAHVSDLKGWQSGGAALYSVKGIPATFLIDKNGKIVGKNLRGEALSKKLAELIPN